MPKKPAQQEWVVTVTNPVIIGHRRMVNDHVQRFFISGCNASQAIQRVRAAGYIGRSKKTKVEAMLTSEYYSQPRGYV